MRKIKVLIEPSEKLTELRNQVADLKAQIAAERQKTNTLEYEYINELKLNMELCDLLKANGVKFRPLLDKRERKKYVRSV